MTMDHSRRGLLRAVTLAGLGALILPGTTLLPTARAAATKLGPTAAVTVNGWLLRSGDR